MIIVKKSTLEVISESQLRTENKNVSFPSVLSNPCLEGFDYTIIQEPEYPILNQFQSVSLGDPYLEDDEIKVEWVVETRVPTILELKTIYERAIDSHLDNKAKEYGYTSVYTMVSYIGDPNPKFDLEARSMFVWRSAVWTYANQMLEGFLAQQGGNDPQPIPEVDSVLASLPTFFLLSE